MCVCVHSQSQDVTHKPCLPSFVEHSRAPHTYLFRFRRWLECWLSLWQHNGITPPKLHNATRPQPCIHLRITGVTQIDGNQAWGGGERRERTKARESAHCEQQNNGDGGGGDWSTHEENFMSCCVAHLNEGLSPTFLCHSLISRCQGVRCDVAGHWDDTISRRPYQPRHLQLCRLTIRIFCGMLKSLDMYW